MGEDPTTRFRENVTGITTTLVTGIWLVGLFAGTSWWLPALLVGYIVVVPLVALLFGDEEDRREWWDEDAASSESDRSREDSTGAEADTESVREAESTRDALETLRTRYARGELTDAQFERKLELLLETDTLENAAEWSDDSRRTGRAREGDRDPDVEFET